MFYLSVKTMYVYERKQNKIISKNTQYLLYQMSGKASSVSKKKTTNKNNKQTTKQ